MIVNIIGGLFVLFLLFRYYQKSTNGICKSKVRLDGKVALVTGSSTGMGLEIAKDLAKRGAKVIIACPFENEGKEAREAIVDYSENEKVVFKLLDLGSLECVRNFAEDILTSEDRLDILVNNAGGVFNFKTGDGFNATIQVNYLGHFLLTLLLLPMLIKSGSSRIVNVASIMHWFGYVDESFDQIDYWHIAQPYSNSKLCLILFTRELNKRLKGTGVTVNTLHPGTVGTNIFSCLGARLGRVISWLAAEVYKTSWEGAQTSIFLAVDPKVSDKSGLYFKDCKESMVSWKARDDEQARELWKKTVIAVKLKDSEVVV